MNSSYQIQRRADATLLDEYGCEFWRILPWGIDGSSENGMGLAIVPPGGRTEPHSHEEVEHFMVIRGECDAHVEQEPVSLQEGDVIEVQSGRVHHFHNTSASVPLELLCLWSSGEIGGATN